MTDRLMREAILYQYRLLTSLTDNGIARTEQGAHASAKRHQTRSANIHGVLWLAKIFLLKNARQSVLSSILSLRISAIFGKDFLPHVCFTWKSAIPCLTCKNITDVTKFISTLIKIWTSLRLLNFLWLWLSWSVTNENFVKS